MTELQSDRDFRSYENFLEILSPFLYFQPTPDRAMMNLPYSESTNKNFIADLENIPVPRELLKKTTAGAFIGYFFIHPLIMILSYYMSVIFPPDGPSIKTGILPEISRSFSVPMLPWSLAFATFGGLVGYYLAKKRQADAARSSLIVQLEASLSTIRKLSGPSSDLCFMQEDTGR